ncbi:MAG: hypothetical protein KA450_05180 [Bacteroidia bacterium]|nr:hypothetical protein [Bacteroidia bacterium]
MKKLLSIICLSGLGLGQVACNNSGNQKTSEKDLELQQKELDLKQKELELKEKQIAFDSAQMANHKPTNSQSQSSTTTTSTQVTMPKSNGIPDHLNKFIGTWSNNDHPIIEISLKNGNFRIRSCSGSDATHGIEFWGTYDNGKITAQGNEQDYYKFQLPTFEVLSNGKLHYDCGAGPYDLKKSSKKMPNVTYSAPENLD